MRSLVVLLLAAVVTVNGSSPVPVLVTEYSDSSYQYDVYNLNGQLVTKRHSSCPPPSSSIEVCLTSLFSTLESQINTIKTSLHVHQSSLNKNMHHEHTLLTSQISWVSAVTKIANSVSSVVGSDYSAVYEQLYALQKELVQIKEMYYYQYAHLESLYVYQRQVINERNMINQQHQYVINAKWSLQGYISAIAQQKVVIESAIAEIEFVVSELDEQIYVIYNKVEQLNKRQYWLGKWEKKLYVDMEAFQKEVNAFRAIQTNLVKRELGLYKDQYRLKKFAVAAEVAVMKLENDISSIQYYVNVLNVYQQEINALYYSVEMYAIQFISEYEVFTCEDNLLYYEACSSTSPLAPAVAPAAAKAAPAAAKAPPAKAAAAAAPAKAAAAAAVAAAPAKAAAAAAPAKAAAAAAPAKAAAAAAVAAAPAKAAAAAAVAAAPAKAAAAAAPAKPVAPAPAKPAVVVPAAPAKVVAAAPAKPTDDKKPFKKDDKRSVIV